LCGRTRIFTLELSKLAEIARKPAEEMSNAEFWAVFFRYHKDQKMRAKINKIAGLEEGIAMAGKTLLNISRDADQRARLESEYKGQLEGRLEGMQEGRLENRMEIPELIAKGYSAEDLKKALQAQ